VNRAVDVVSSATEADPPDVTPSEIAHRDDA
jgi:hypothetical protein